jgi:mannosyltransferase
MKFLPDMKNKNIRVIYNGVSDNYFLIEKDIQLSFQKNSYILFVGGRVAYKNFELAVKAVSLSDYKLVIVGPPLSKKEKLFLDECLGQLHFEFLGYISDEYLNILYNNAFALLYPSIYEGFGIPILEAQKAGCPVIAYNNSSVPEIIGDRSLLLDDLSVDAILKCFALLHDNKNRIQIINNGLNKACNFTWDKMYSQIIDLYKEAWLLK